jgi:tetratricopeptide (TPR) repeat protein
MTKRFSIAVFLVLAIGAGANAQLSQHWQGCFPEQDRGPDDAIAACTQIIRGGNETPGNLSVAYSNRGHNFLRKDDLESALQDFNEAIRIDPKNAQAWTNRGEAYQRKKDYQKAISDHTEAIRLDPKHPDAWFNRGIAYHNMGNEERAVADYRQALKVNPEDQDARRQLRKLGINE